MFQQDEGIFSQLSQKCRSIQLAAQVLYPSTISASHPFLPMDQHINLRHLQQTPHLQLPFSYSSSSQASTTTPPAVLPRTFQLKGRNSFFTTYEISIGPNINSPAFYSGSRRSLAQQLWARPAKSWIPWSNSCKIVLILRCQSKWILPMFRLGRRRVAWSKDVFCAVGVRVSLSIVRLGYGYEVREKVWRLR
jgi:hypothetical protein